MEYIRHSQTIIAKMKDESGNIFKIDLGVNSLTKTDAELEQLALEKYTAIKEREANPPAPTYEELRAKEYPSTDKLVVALWEKVVEGRPEEADKLQAERLAVKQKYPKGLQKSVI